MVWPIWFAGQSPPDDRFKNFETWYKAFPSEEPDVVLRVEDPCQMTYTSGTESLPKRVIIADALPKTPTGKILKRNMRDQYKDLFS